MADSHTRQDFEAAVTNHDMDRLIEMIPYANTIGIQSINMGDDFIFKLAKNDDNIGNPLNSAIHGGVLGGFMETSAALYAMMFADVFKVPKVVNFSIDYLKPGKHRDSYARCTIVKQGRKIANVSVTAWQSQENKPIATARAHFLVV